MTSTEQALDGIPVSPGIAIGYAHVQDRLGPVTVDSRDLTPDEVEPEVDRFLRAVEVSRTQLERIRKQVAEAIDEKHADIFLAQAEFLNDPEIVDNTVADIRKLHKNAEYLLNRHVTKWMQILSSIEDESFKARNSDLLDVTNRIFSNLGAVRVGGLDGIYAPGSVLIASDLTPSDTANLMKQQIAGFALEKGGATSHTAIMAKAMEIPAVVGVNGVTRTVPHGVPVIIDGFRGRVLFDPAPATLARYKEEQAQYSSFERELSMLRDLPAETLDGYSVTMRANVELVEEASHVSRHGAAGIGLFRTEFLFMNRQHMPTEQEQYEIYRDTLKQVSPNPVVFRTLDFGGDKIFSNDPSYREVNPFMGQRAIRFCLNHPELFHSQLRAMLRASAHGPTRILIPMISGVEEWREVKRRVRRAKAELKMEKIPYDPRVQLGAMIEIPSAAVAAEELARECDFFSIGTNDLIQYTLAVDRGNARVAYLYQAYHPAVLRLIRNTVLAAQKSGIPVSVCGEMAADPISAVLLLGIGVDEFSMSAVNIPLVKRLIRSIDLFDSKVLAEEALQQTCIQDVQKVLHRRLKPYLDRDKGGHWFRTRSAHSSAQSSREKGPSLS